MANVINETIDSNDALMNEAFEKLSSFINSNKFTNADVMRSNRILKNLTKQIWTKLSLFKKRYAGIAKNKGLAAIPMDKKFIDEFLSQIKADDTIKKAVYDSVSKEIRILNRVYQGVRTRKTTKEELQKRFKDNNINPTTVMSHVINAIALETTLKYLDNVEGGLDFDSLDPNNKRKAIGKMSAASKGILGGIVDGITRAASERGKKA